MDMTIVVGAILLSMLMVLLYFNRQKSRKNQELEDLLNHTTAKLERLQIHFGRFTPDEVIEHLTDKSGQYAPNLRTVTVLFADLRNFTEMCSSLSPQEVVSMLNGYFRSMSEVISRNHGQVTELTGDGILALFGALRHNPWQVRDAVKAALQMREELVQYNRQLEKERLPELSFGIGIHRGKVLAGVMGNFELSKFGVVGDTINVAARVEALTKEHQCDILITEEVRTELNDQFELQEMPAMPIKGKEQLLKTFQLKGFTDQD